MWWTALIMVARYVNDVSCIRTDDRIEAVSYTTLVQRLLVSVLHGCLLFSWWCREELRKVRGQLYHLIVRFQVWEEMGGVRDYLILAYLITTPTKICAIVDYSLHVHCQVLLDTPEHLNIGIQRILLKTEKVMVVKQVNSLSMSHVCRPAMAPLTKGLGKFMVILWLSLVSSVIEEPPCVTYKGTGELKYPSLRKVL